MYKKILTLAGIVFFSACSAPNTTIELPTLQEPSTLSREGKIYKLPTNINSEATHRLEYEGKLSAFLTSNKMNLPLFEGENVVVEGQWKTDKMRQVFEVEEITLKRNLPADFIAETEENLFRTKDIAFLYPKNWKYWGGDTDQIYFYEANDELQKVKATFGVKQKEKLQFNTEYNGKKVAETLEQSNTTSKRIISLYNEEETFVYEFSFRPGEETPENIADFRKMISSFAINEKQKKQLEKEFFTTQATPIQELLKKEDQEQKAIEELQKASEEDQKTETSEIENIETKEETKTEEKKENEEIQTSKEPKKIYKGHVYTSPLGFTAIFPLKSWYRNFGVYEDARTILGVSTQKAVESINQSEITVRLVPNTSKNILFPPKKGQTLGEGQSPAGNFYEITKNFGQNQMFVARGPIRLKQMMKDILYSIE